MTFQMWGRVTGKDKRNKTPNQQAVFLGSTGDYTTLNPYGLYCDLPAQTLLIRLKNDAAMGCAQTRPADVAQGEPTFYHPPTGTRIIARNSGDLDILEGAGGGNLNIVCTTLNATCSTADVIASGGVSVTCDTSDVTAATSAAIAAPGITLDGNVTVTGNLQVDGDFNNDGIASLGGAGGKAIARKDDPTDGSKILAGSPQHTAT